MSREKGSSSRKNLGGRRGQIKGPLREVKGAHQGWRSRGSRAARTRALYTLAALLPAGSTQGPYQLPEACGKEHKLSTAMADHATKFSGR